MDWDAHIQQLKAEATAFQVTDDQELDAFRLRFISKKGAIADLFQAFAKLSVRDKQSIGKALNGLKAHVGELFTFHIAHVADQKERLRAQEKLDPTLPMDALPPGSTHVLTRVRRKMEDIFVRVGFELAEGPEIESEEFNFSDLNFAEDHPARAMQDTFFLPNIGTPSAHSSMLLRTHTSSVQIRMMKAHAPPLRLLMPGRVYRNEAITARAHCFFHQVEGLYVDEQVGFSDLKRTLNYFVQQLFGQNTAFRLRASYFPFTAPSAELDIECMLCKSRGCTLCKGSGWLEIAGCGMVHPEVLRRCNVSPDKYSGYAFGMGVERIAMLQTGINDIRVFTRNDLAFLSQYAYV